MRINCLRNRNSALIFSRSRDMSRISPPSAARSRSICYDGCVVIHDQLDCPWRTCPGFPVEFREDALEACDRRNGLHDSSHASATRPRAARRKMAVQPCSTASPFGCAVLTRTKSWPSCSLDLRSLQLCLSKHLVNGPARKFEDLLKIGEVRPAWVHGPDSMRNGPRIPA